MDKKIVRSIPAHPAMPFRPQPRRISFKTVRRARGPRALRDRRSPR
jgi:hypothetical protein